tara:strand:- start:2191 stop:2391 length:201 start_codon:yes stop_codon:yes gene_type:complete
MSNQDKLDVVKNVRFESFYGGEPVIMTRDEANEEFLCLIEALQGHCADGAVFAMDDDNNDLFIAWD